MNIPLALTYDDVLLVPRYSTVKSRSDVNIRTKLTKNITINNPIISANMDTITEAEMCIAMARHGSIGIIHRFNSIEEQAEMVKKVKRAETYRVDSPYTCLPNLSVAELRQMMKEKEVGSFIVVDEDDRLSGIVSTRDLLFADNTDLVIDVMTLRSDMITGAPETTLEEARLILQRNKLEKLPLVNADDHCVGLITAKDIKYKMQRPFASLDHDGKLLVGAAIGVKDDYLQRAEALVAAGVDVLVIDIAHGHSLLAIEATQQVKSHFPKIELIAGNVATAEGTDDLIRAGADAIKVGVGPGSICITRDITGCGVPQLTAVMNCVEAARKHDIPIIADGGIKKSGDIVKALAAGANTVMLGSLLAGTDECPGEQINKGGQKVKVIRGMAGYGANLSKNLREKKDTRDVFQITPEGVEAVVPYRGKVADVLNGLIGGLKSGVSYCGAISIESLQENAEFVRITQAGRIESTHHDVKVI